MSANHLERVARKKLGVGEEWTAYLWECLRPPNQDIYRIGIGVSRALKSGPRKGQPKWDGERAEVFVTQAELDASLAAYESNTGCCHQCEGTGQTFASWSVSSGATFRDCSRCGGIGTAP